MQDPFITMVTGDIDAIITALTDAKTAIEGGDITSDAILNDFATAKTTFASLEPIVTAGVNWVRQHQEA